MPESQLTRIVAGCVLEKDDKYLLVQEKREAVHGKWNLPAGRVDEGETIEQAVVREAFEETGYKVKLVSKLRVEHEDASRPILHSYKASIIGGDLLYPEDELLDARWFTLKEIEALLHDGNLRTEWVLRSIKDAHQLITWNVYEVSSKSAQLNGVSLRGRIRKWGLEKNINVITDNAEDAINVVRFATLHSDDGTAISEYIKSIVGDVQIELKLEAVANPVLSKLKVNIESRYQI